MILTKSTEDPILKRDGRRLFVTRYWPRGHARKECDEWLPCLAPSEKLLHAFLEGKTPWSKFAQEYKRQISKGFAGDAQENPRVRNSGQKYLLRLLKMLEEEQTITLICSCPPDAEHCHRFLLRDLIARA